VIRQLTGGHNGIDPWTIRTRALELEGYMPGDVVLVDLNATPKPGDVVCAQIYEWPVMRANTVMRVFHRASPVKLLLSRSLDPAFAQPYVVDDDRVVVKGVILPHRLRTN
jgi:SOS-response transcriptional repressor LexA